MERLEQLTKQTVTKNSLSCPNATTGSGSKAPVKVTITGAAGNIGYALVFMIGQGYMFGPNQPVDLTLLELPNAEQKLQGVIMELDDCALPLVSSVRGTTDYKVGFDKADFCILVGARPRGPGMERQDLLSANAAIFKGQGEAINSFASRNVQVLVVGNPANTNCMIAATYAPSIPRENFTALTRLDQNRALHQISAKVKTDAKNVKNLIIWGNHSTTQFPDISFGYIENYPTKGFKTSLKGAVNDDAWFQKVFVDTVAKRGAEIIKARELSSAASAASAVCDHIRDWVNGTRDGEYVSMAVMSDGSYGVSKDLCFSFPVVCRQGKWEVVKGYTFDAFSKKQIEDTTKELVEEREMALGGLQK